MGLVGSEKGALRCLVVDVNHNWSDEKPNADLVLTHDAGKGMCLFILGDLNNAVIILLTVSPEQMLEHLSRICSMLCIERVARRKHVIITKPSKLK